MKMACPAAVLLLAALLGFADALVVDGHGQGIHHVHHDKKPLWIDDGKQVPSPGEGEEAEDSEESKDSGAPAAPAWTSTGPDSTDYNKETHVDHLPFSIETLIAAIYCLLIASAPIWLAAFAEQQLTRAHMLESVALVVWLMSVLYMFTNVLKFQSLHWEGTRPLTIVEAVYLLSQILTTVGYGDMTPAFPRGQVWVGINVILGLCLYGSIIMEVVDIVTQRVKKALTSGTALQSEDRSMPLKDWLAGSQPDKSNMVRSAAFFGTCATIGILFWHFYPGEGKTWLQAVYMSIITLSTVGFGAFNATTEGGKVFGAFWMLIGVASLGALVTSFIELMVQEKQAEKYNPDEDIVKFQKVLDACLKGSKDGKMTKLEFFKYGMMISKGTDTKTFEKLEARFKKLSTKVGGLDAIRRSDIVDEEGPPLM